MYVKRFPIESTDTTTDNPSIPVDDDFLIWTSTKIMFVFFRYKIQLKDSPKINIEDE
jgi:hypothetical protein